MQARMPERDAEKMRHARVGADGRWMLAIGKRIDHRWIMETTLGRRCVASASDGHGHGQRAA